jgi:glycosyltransferase involved in cell wall biosynthesis
LVEWIWFQNKDYYVSFSRLTHAKRINTIIRAFQKIPDKKIVILYGKNDSQKNEFIKLGEWYPNIIFHELSDNNHLPHIISGATMSISISESEDFGMVAIESMACGVPVIAVDEWGYRESMISGQTGYLIDPHYLEENLVEIIQNTDNKTLRNMEKSCRDRALNFSLAVMNTKMKQYIQ